MNKTFSRLLGQLDDLNLPSDQYAIFGSGPLAVRGIRDTHDIDILVTPSLFEKLEKQYPSKMMDGNKLLEVGDIEVMITWPGTSLEKVQKMIKQSEQIEGHPFVKLNHLIQSKKKMARPKDLKDIELIKKYQSEKTNH